jgi:hypothetical protein
VVSRTRLEPNDAFGGIGFVIILGVVMEEGGLLSASRAKSASTNAAACAGIMATPARILAETINFPCQVIGVISPNPTICSVSAKDNIVRGRWRNIVMYCALSCTYLSLASSTRLHHQGNNHVKIENKRVIQGENEIGRANMRNPHPTHLQ